MRRPGVGTCMLQAEVLYRSSGVARVGVVRGPVPGVGRFYGPPRKRSHGSLGYLQHTLVLLERRRGKAPFAHHMHVLYYSHPRRYR